MFKVIRFLRQFIMAATLGLALFVGVIRDTFIYYGHTTIGAAFPYVCGLVIVSAWFFECRNYTAEDAQK